MRSLATAPFLVCVFFMIGCGQPIKNSTLFSKASDECEGSVAKGKYIVQWKNGELTREVADSDEEFISEIVIPNESEIEFAEPDYRVEIRDRVMRSSFFGTTVADNWGPQDTQADVLWQQNVRGEGVTVAVIDTGADINHLQLQSQIAVNSGEAGALKNNGLDDDHDGFVDNYYGYDFVNNRGLTEDNQFHGTHVSGIIAASHNDTVAKGGARVEGIAPEAKIMPLAFLDSEGGGDVSNAVRAIDYAVKHGAKVINASWGGTVCSVSLKNKVASLYEKNIIFVVAAGNSSNNIDSQKEFPAAFGLLSQITVGSVSMSGFMAEHSNYGVNNVHIFAPGEDIVSTMPGNQMVALTGTSMATPFVTGAVALLLSAEPTATVSQIRQALYLSANHYSGYLNASQGRLNLATALTTLRSAMTP